jgi:hypothetical protein
MCWWKYKIFWTSYKNVKMMIRMKYREKNDDHNICNINVFKLHTPLLRTFKILVGKLF